MIRVVFFALIASSLWGKPLEVTLQARSAILMNGETGAILYEKHAHTPSFPASITKIATALFVLDQKKGTWDEVVTVSGEALRFKNPQDLKHALPHWLEPEGTMMWLAKGEKVSLDALLHGLMLVSGNDAANVLAETVSGSVPQFIEQLNEYVRDLGCLHTQFRNPHGLHHPEHFTTAYDICLVTKKALQFPKFRSIVSSLSYMKPKTNKQPVTEFFQKNPLLKSGKFHYSKAIGVKTGYTSHAQHTLVAAAEHDGRLLIAVVLGCKQKGEHCADVTRLFEAAFAEEKKSQRLIGPESLFTQKVEGGAAPVEAALADEVVISFYPAEEPAYRAFVRWELPALPIQKGQRVGRIEVLSAEGVLLTQGPLFAQVDVKPTLLFRMKQWFK